jgi:hypothetical protein
VSEPTIGPRGSVLLARVDDGFVAAWPKVEAPDSGTDPTPFLAGFDVVDLDASGVLVRREVLPSPRELRERKGSIEDIGIARERGATLLHWTESVTSTEPDGRVRTAFVLKGSYGDDRVVTVASCERCAMRMALVAFAEETIAIVRTEPDHVLDVEIGEPPPPPSFTGVRVRRDGTVETVVLPRLAPEKPRIGGIAVVPNAPLGAVRDLDGRIVVTTDGNAWQFDRSLRAVAGPIALPSTDALALWGPSDAATPALLWSISANEEERSTSQFTRREIFLANGAFRDRLTHGRAVFAADRRGDEIGLVFESAGRSLFVASSADGKKRGGDVFVRTVESSASQFGGYEPQDATVIASTGAGRFTVVDLGRGHLFSTEIVCAP